jgi:hypothetical protein
MNPKACEFQPNPNETFTISAEKLSKNEIKIFQKLVLEWTHTPTLDLLLTNWKNRLEQTQLMLNIKHDISVLLLNVSSLKLYLLDVFNLINSHTPPIIVLNGTYHDDDTIKRFTQHFTNYNVHSMKGTNRFGGVLVAVHRSTPVKRLPQFENIQNLIVIEIGISPETFQLVTCYSPPTEMLPFSIFDQILKLNRNTIFPWRFQRQTFIVV